MISQPKTTNNSSLKVNPNYDGRTDLKILANTSTLSPNVSDTLWFSVNVIAKESKTYWNTAYVSAISGDTLEVQDISMDGITPQSTKDQRKATANEGLAGNNGGKCRNRNAIR